MNKEYYYCNEFQFPNIEMYLFGLEYEHLPKSIPIIKTDKNTYLYKYIFEFGKWRLVTA